MSKYDKKTPVVFNRELIGHMVQKRTAEEYASDVWALSKLRKAWYENVNNSKNSFRTPIIKGDNE